MKCEMVCSGTQYVIITFCN